MEKAILNVKDNTLSFKFHGKDFVVDVSGMDYDHWDVINEDDVPYDLNIWFDEFVKGTNSFQLAIYNLVPGFQEGTLDLGDCECSYSVDAINYEGDLEEAVFGSVDTQSVNYIKEHYNKMKLVIDNESVNIYIDNGDDKDPTQIVYWHLDEVEEDANVAISIASAIDLFHTDKLKLIETLFGQVK